MKRFVLAVVLALGLCVFAALPASAENASREAEITYRSIKIVLNGQEICPRDAAGNEVEPFVLNGTTYLPVRAVAEALGLEVRWRGSDSTVMLSRDEDERLVYYTGIEMPPEPPRKAESAHGHSGTEKVTLSYRNVRLLFDGVVIQPKDAAGNEVEPFILGGTTYLPVRAVAEALGFEVDWDAETSTVRLSSWLVARRHTACDDGYGSSWFTEERYEYDALGRPVHELDSTDTDSSESRWYYDGNGRLTRRELSSQESDGVFTSSVTSYVYDAESGLCLSAETEEENKYYEISWRSTVKIGYEYDGEGRLVRAARSSDGEEDRICEWTYDGAGRVTGLRQEYVGKSEWVRSYTYDGEGRLVLVESETHGEDDGEPYSYGWQNYSGYDADGREVLYGTRGSSDGDYEERKTYDGTGRLVRMEREPSAAEGDEDEDLVEVTEYFYDERGFLARQRTSDAFGYAAEYVYICDEGGKLIQYDYFRMNLRQTWEYVKVGG